MSDGPSTVGVSTSVPGSCAKMVIGACLSFFVGGWVRFGAPVSVWGRCFSTRGLGLESLHVQLERVREDEPALADLRGRQFAALDQAPHRRAGQTELRCSHL